MVGSQVGCCATISSLLRGIGKEGMSRLRTSLIVLLFASGIVLSARAQSAVQTHPHPADCDGKFDPEAAKSPAAFPIDTFFRLGPNPDYAGRLECLRKRVASGQADAMIGLALAYYYGEGLKSDVNCTTALLEHAANLGDVAAMEKLADMYLGGWKGFAENDDLAGWWLEKAFAGGSRDAALGLADMYNGRKGVVPDRKRAAELYKKILNWLGAPRDNIWSAAATDLGNLYYWGEGVPQNDNLALKYYHEAAALGDNGAMMLIAGMYTNGRGVPKDPAQAKIWLDAAARVEAKEDEKNARFWAEYDKYLNGGREPPPYCKLSDLNLTLPTREQTGNYVVVGLQIENLSDQACRVGRAEPSLPWSDIKFCANCSAAGSSSPRSFTNIEPHGFAYVTFRWKNAPSDQDAGCKSVKQMDVSLAGVSIAGVSPSTNVALGLGFPMPLPQVCSTVDVSPVTPGRDPYLMDTNHPAPVTLEVSSPKPAYYEGEKVVLHARAQAAGSMPLDNQCALLFKRTRSASGVTSYYPMVVEGWRCKVIPPSAEAPATVQLELPGMVSSAGTIGDHAMQLLILSSTGVDKDAWRWLAVSNPVEYRVDDPKQIVRHWSPQVKGLAIDITLDKTTYNVDEEIPIHVALANFSAPEPVAADECFPVILNVRDVDGQRIRGYGRPFCITTATPIPHLLSRGDIATYERAVGPLSQPGLYTVTGTWPAYVHDESPSRLTAIGASAASGFPNAYVPSTPVTIRVIDPNRPDRGRFAPSAPWPENFVEVDTAFGPDTALLDKTTGLKWLHIGLADDQSYQAVKQAMMPGAPFAGWRYATVDEVQKIFSDFYGAFNGHSKDPTNDRNISAVFQGALGGFSIFGDIPGAPNNGACLKMVGEHPVITDHWNPSVEEAPACSYLVQQAESPHN